MFKENLELPIEIQLDSDQNEELSYRVNSRPGFEYFQILLTKFPKVVSQIDFQTIELISYHKADNISYSNDCICLVINQVPNDIRFKDLIDFYVLKFDVKNLKIKSKYYKKYNKIQIYWFENLFNPVSSFKIAFEFGVGFYPESDKYNDFYFYVDTKDIKLVQELTNLKIDNGNTTDEKSLLAITVDNFKILKLKRYLYQYPLDTITIKDIYGSTN